MKSPQPNIHPVTLRKISQPLARRFIASFLLLTTAASSVVFAAGVPIEVYLIGGQSNATGQGYVKNLPADFVPNSLVPIFHSGAPHLNGAGPANEWHALQPAAESPDRFGPELGFGNRLKELRIERRIALIKHAHSGTNLHAEWNPGSAARDRAHWGAQFAVFVETVDAGLKRLRETGFDPEVKGMIWMQGEADADKGGAEAGAYAKNLSRFIRRVREQFHAPDLVFVIGQIAKPPESGLGRDVVRQAQKDLAENSRSSRAIRGVCYVATDDLTRRADDPDTPYPNDRNHFSSSSQLELGRRMADAMDARLNGPPKRAH